MIGGLLKSSSKLALMAAAGILVGGVSMGSAKAADLGGDCCADLEERVAELEATTARKGNRKVSLTISGQINKQIMYTADSVRSRTLAGIDNINSSSRFIFSGNAKVTSSITAGFEMMMEWSGPSRSDTLSQRGTDQNLFVVNGATTPVGILTNTSNDSSISIRTANWWLEDKVLGRVTVGRVNIGGPSSIIDISGGDVSLIAWSNPALQGGGLFLAPAAGGGAYFTNTLASIAPWCYGCSRDEGIRYDSASFFGFTFGAYWGEQDRFSIQARYAAEYMGFQIAAGAGYQHDNNLGIVLPNANPAPLVAMSTRTDSEQQAYALSIKHVATGLFAQGNMGRTHWDRIGGAGAGAKNDGNMWQIQGGIAKNWFGPGVTAFYGEYGRGSGYASGSAASTLGTVPGATNGNFVATGAGFISADSIEYYGLGMTQKIDAAAMTLYLGWRHFNPKISTSLSGNVPLSEIDTVIGGARIQF